jgi:hypothetical protein
MVGTDSSCFRTRGGIQRKGILKKAKERLRRKTEEEKIGRKQERCED